jgi:hypothetical protein
MKLPYVEMAEVPEEKITRYLLNAAHPAGGSKAVFFLRSAWYIDPGSANPRFVTAHPVPKS